MTRHRSSIDGPSIYSSSPTELPDLLPNVSAVFTILILLIVLIAVILAIGLYISAFPESVRYHKRSSCGQKQPLLSSEVTDESEMAYSSSANTPLTPSFPPEAPQSTVQQRRTTTASAISPSRFCDIEAQPDDISKHSSSTGLCLLRMTHCLKTFSKVIWRYGCMIGMMVEQLAVVIVVWTRDDADERDLVVPMAEEMMDDGSI